MAGVVSQWILCFLILIHDQVSTCRQKPLKYAWNNRGESTCFQGEFYNIKIEDKPFNRGFRTQV